MTNALQVKYANTASQYHKGNQFSTEMKTNEFIAQDVQNPVPMMPVSVSVCLDDRYIRFHFIPSIPLT